MNKRMRAGLIAVAAVAVVLSCIPAESVVVPAWSVQVVDKDSRPVEGINVRQVWQDYSVESTSHEEMLVTPPDGRVSFPERKISTPRIMRVLGPVKNALATGVHAGFGNSCWLIVWGKDGLEGHAIYTPGQPLPASVTVKPRGL